ncbi:MAG: bifunctional phosphoribosyl-AMP cyclohydrolase/phosphoribosyl-ATP diphosphatase HisIE [Thermoanaerobaculia bacterium]
MKVDFSKGLVPAVVRDSRSGMILMLAYMNEDAYQRTMETGQTWFWSRSHNELWNKGATSGNRQRVTHVATDCDSDALVVTVDPAGPACHTGAESCFAEVPPPALDLERLMQVLRNRRETRPEGSYSAYLFNEGRDKILKKIGEEATEVVIAGKGDSRERMVSEVTDLMFHLAILMTDAGLEWSDVGNELRKRER